MSKPRIIAFYLPQYYPTDFNDNGGSRVLQSGLTLLKPSRCSQDITNPSCLVSSGFTICDCHRRERDKLNWLK